jgi:hypothetical protein
VFRVSSFDFHRELTERQMKLSRRSLIYAPAGALLLHRRAKADLLSPSVSSGDGGLSVPPLPPPLQGTIHHIAPSGSDQTTTVQNTINRAAAGDTIYFDSGTHVINGTIRARSNLLYIGPTVQFNSQARAVLQLAGGVNWDFAGANRITVYGLTFANARVHLTGDTIAITNCNFTFPSQQPLSFLNPSGLSNATISWNTAQNLGLTGDSGNNLNNVTITRNKVLGAIQSYTIDPTGGTGDSNIAFTFNYCDDSSRFTLEIAESGPFSATGFTINDNYFVTSQSGISVVAGGTAEIARNFVLRLPSSNPDFGGVEFQCPGTGHIHDNYIVGPGHLTGFNAGIFGSYDSTDSSLVQNNNVINCDSLIVVPVEPGGLAQVSGTTSVYRGIPAIPAGGAGP